MKQCPYCGLQNDDTAIECVTCHTALPTEASFPAPETKPVPVISPQEARFWQRMNFHKFAILLVKLQGVWLLLNAVVELTYLPRYISRWLLGSSYSVLSSEMKRDAALMVFRLVLYGGVGLALIQYAERFLSWLVKDWVAQEAVNPPAPVPAPTSASSRGPNNAA